MYKKGIDCGANIDAIKVAQDIGIKAERAVRYNNDSQGVQMNYCVMSEAVSSYRRSRKIDDSLNENIEEYFVERGKKVKVICMGEKWDI